ncbi:MAG: hypothetical protein BGO98_18525 [Myxococcales bacterium 68-20]|nr:MAG: hypothetical protein BGO98_18525 [Myxococcales bacterium 68-20]
MVLQQLVAHADDRTDVHCTAGLPSEVREEIAKTYECDLRRIRCIDGQIGRAFTSAGYIDGNKWVQKAVPGSRVSVRAFALHECAAPRLSGISFQSGTIKAVNSFQQTAPAATSGTSASSGKAGADKAGAAVSDAKQKIDAKQKDAGSKITKAITAANSLPGLPTDVAALCVRAPAGAQKNSCLRVANAFKGSLSSATPAVQEKPQAALTPLVDALSDGGPFTKLEELHPPPGAQNIADIKLLMTEALAAQTQTTADIKDLLTQLRKDVSADLKAAPSSLLESVLRDIDAVTKDPGDWSRVNDALKAAKTTITQFSTNAAVESAKEKPAWPGSTLSGRAVAVREEVLNVPDGNDNAFFTITISNTVGGVDENGNLKGDRLWPDNTLSVLIDHGRYYWDFGVMFSAVSNGKSNFDNGSTTPSSHGWAFQPMITGSVYFTGRQKFTPWSAWHLIPGLQAGINMDLSKIENAVSLGLIEEPVTGLAISGGAMLYSRPTAPAAANGTQPTEHVILPYVGVTLNTEFYNSVKAIAKPSDNGG